jgi:3-oxoacyl-[acyl-carrier protein] reductase
MAGGNHPFFSLEDTAMRHTDLGGKVAVVTGAARGIGRESAKLLAEAGAAVAICDVNLEEAERTAGDFLREGPEAFALPVDVADEESVRAMIAGASGRRNRLDILVNNAGILDPASVPEVTAEKWDRMLAVNLRGAHFCSREAFPHLARNGWGKIVNISSQAGQYGGFLAGVHYSAAKGGVLALTKAYARYGAPHQVTVNCVAPGFMLTDMTRDRKDDPSIIPLKRLGTALDAAKAVFFLSTSLSDYITGATIDVNGGYYMR